MFSYIHGIRSSNRRSAIPPAAPPRQPASSRYYHELTTSPPTSSYSFGPQTRPATHANISNRASPISANPPILPPIPRVASHNEGRSADKERIQGQDEDSSPNRTRRGSSAGAPEALAGTTSDESRSMVARDNHPRKGSWEAEGSQRLMSPQQPHPAPSRRKRPNDHPYVSMRSESEPPNRQTLNNNPDAAVLPPQPNREPSIVPAKPPCTQSHPQRLAPPPPVMVQSQAAPMTLSTTIHKGHGKTKLNLLNPMSLLARRRSTQSVEEARSQNQHTPNMPDNYDPRIRGNVVHDFSAPRPGRPLSSNGASQDVSLAHMKGTSPNRHSQAKQDDDSPSSTEKEHTPIFSENFDDDVEPWTSDMDSPAKRRTSAFMYQVSLHASQAPTQSSLPAFARNLPCNISDEIDALRKSSTPSPKAPLTVLLETPLSDQKSAQSSPPISPPKTRSQSAQRMDPTYSAPLSPQRFTSNASRFSFDLAGVGSAAQEKLLEEKHRQKANRKERESTLSDGNEVEENDDYDDYDGMEDDGLEEKIPGVNIDDEDDEMPSLQHAMDTSNFVSPNKSSFESTGSPVSTGLTSPGTPRDNGQLVEPLESQSPRQQSLFQLGKNESLSKAEHLRPKSTPGGSTGSDFSAQPLQREAASESNLAGLPTRYNFQDDDIYFDDGMIDDFEGGDYEAFDESVFDDDTSRIYGVPLRDLKPLLKPHNQSLSVDGLRNTAERPPTSEALHNKEKPSSCPHNASRGGDVMAEMKEAIENLSQPAQSIKPTTGLTQDNLGLHDRLAFAANQAALEGKFKRTYSQGSTHESPDGPTSSLGTTTKENQWTGLFVPQLVVDANEYAFDDANTAYTEAEDDDPIIAAANAEALENDDDGFYGQEFGFFARQPGSSESEYANGGYFGSRAVNEGIHRMNSGRDNFQEPSLTPITERSEWSNRNSMVSLAMHGYPLSAQYQSNPQLADLMRVQEGEEMSLEGLRKLRCGAWGGSNGSLPSGTNSQGGGSPLTYLAHNTITPLMQANQSNASLMSPSSQNLAGSYHSFSSGGQVSSNDSNSSPSAESPTITLSTSQSGLMIHQATASQPPPPTNPSPRRLSALEPKPWAPGHSRTSSGTESVSYREENGRWLCEKTRVIEETGEIEVLGRSVVEGGRI